MANTYLTYLFRTLFGQKIALLLLFFFQKSNVSKKSSKQESLIKAEHEESNYWFDVRNRVVQSDEDIVELRVE